MSLFEPLVVCELTPNELGLLTKPIVGDGGHQGLLRKITQHLQGSRVEVEPADLRKAVQYAYDYDTGGYQGRFIALLRAAYRAGWDIEAGVKS